MTEIGPDHEGIMTTLEYVCFKDNHYYKIKLSLLSIYFNIIYDVCTIVLLLFIYFDSWVINLYCNV